uniref:RRM domain-containing protein n=1 Tax=Alexandrium catenella TaxID=2925 RepID=A0A7S1WVJ7_ALECA|mmetsp:Transcript_93428/g.248022  ORF Transcript_93428/g.248022 Transcript_93428/m.248022 type:complete len:281 (+) Transcript_93428:83-925(+)
MMACASVQMVAGVRMMVKNTFLEVAEATEQPQISRSKTEPVATMDTLSCLDGDDSPDSDAESVASESSTPSKLSVGSGTAASSSLPELVSPQLAGAAAADERSRPEAASKTGETRRGRDAARRERRVGGAQQQAAKQGLTTVMLRNLPNDYTRGMLQKLLEKRGFAGKYDFLYLPTDFSRKAGLGYAFVNMLSEDGAKAVRRSLEGFRQWSIPSTKVCCVGWSNPCQGLLANIERYRDSPVMHPSVPDEYKPILLQDGKRVPFPEPTRMLRRPTMRKSGQ